MADMVAPHKTAGVQTPVWRNCCGSMKSTLVYRSRRWFSGPARILPAKQEYLPVMPAQAGVQVFWRG